MDLRFSATPKPTPVQLAGYEPPKTKLNRTLGIIELGKQHKFWHELIKLIAASPTQSSILETRASLTAGSGFALPDAGALTEFLSKSLFVDGRPNPAAFLKGTADDIAAYNGYAWEVIWSARGGEVVELHYRSFVQHAVVEPAEDGIVREYLLSADWTDRVRNPPVRIAAFDPETATADTPQLLVNFVPARGVAYYPLPSWQSGIDAVASEGNQFRFYRNQSGKNFTGSTLFKIKTPEPIDLGNGEMLSPEQQVSIFKRQVTDTYSGPNGDSLMFLTGENIDQMATIEALPQADSSKMFAQYNSQSRDGILAANRVNSPVVVGIPSGAQLGGAGNEIYAAYEVFLQTVCVPDQTLILEGMHRVLLHVAGVSEAEIADLRITTTLPVAEPTLATTVEGQTAINELLALVTSGDLTRENAHQRLTLFFKLTDEQAEAILPPAKPADAGRPPQTAAQAALAGSVGGQTAIDAMLTQLAQNLTTRESCISRLKIFYGLTQEEADAIVPISQPPLPLPTA